MNDMLGELEVDNMLHDIGGVFLKPGVGFRSTDVALHLHGDTFGVLMPNITPEKAADAIFRPIKEIAKLEQQYILQPTFSIGIAGIPTEEKEFSTANELLEASLIASTHAKIARMKGINPSVVIYTPGMTRVEHKKANNK